MNGQPSLPLWDQPVSVRRKKRGVVRSTSVAVAHELSAHIDARAQTVLTLMAVWREVNTTLDGAWQTPTAGDLYQLAAYRDEAIADSGPITGILRVRRGLSELSARHLIEPASKKRDPLTGKTCLTWKIVR